MAMGEDLFPGGDPVVLAICKACMRATYSKRCEKCGGEQAACAVCGRCPPCDGPAGE